MELRKKLVGERTWVNLGVNEERLTANVRGPLQHQVENVPTNGQQRYLKLELSLTVVIDIYCKCSTRNIRFRKNNNARN